MKYSSRGVWSSKYSSHEDYTVCFVFVLLQFHLDSPDDDVLDYGILSDSDVVNKTFILYNPNPIRVSTRM